MGAVTFSINPNLLLAAKSALNLDVFVETGTFLGDTIILAKPYFKAIYSIELSQKYHTRAADKFKADQSVTLLQGNSAEQVTSLVKKLAGRSIFFWLDAHWCEADETAGKFSQCPLINELRAIQQLNDQSIVAIDDARLFLAPPPAPHEISQWPNFYSILKELEKLSSRHILLIVNDNLLFVPQAVEQVFYEYAYKEGVNWLTVLDKSRDYDKLLVQLQEKEQEIHRLKSICDERLLVIKGLTKL